MSRCTHDHCCDPVTPAAQPARAQVSGEGVRTTVRIEQMDCPTEKTLIEDRLAGMPGIAALEFNLVQRTLTLVHAPAALEGALAALRSIGFDAVRPGQPAATAPATHAATGPGRLQLALSGVLAVCAEGLHWIEVGPGWLVAACAIASILCGGLGTYRKGWIALRHGNLNMNALMSIAVTGAAAIGQWPEAAMVMFLFALAERIEQASLERARRAIGDLLRSAPAIALVRDDDGGWCEREAALVPIGAIVLVRPGERLALDGVVTAGTSAVNQAAITGESLPVDKSTGDAVYAGTLNHAGAIECRVTAAANDSTLAHIIHAVERAQGARSPTQSFVDRFARVYTPVVFVLALAVAVVPPLLADGLWLEWIYRALVLLVIACPCALVISTPVTIVSALAASARHGVLVKGGTFLEGARRLAWIVFDKTGTITHGRPVQTDFAVSGDADPARVRAVAAALAARSDHPVARAISDRAGQDGVGAPTVESFAAVDSLGIEGRIDGVLYRLGSRRLADRLGLADAVVAARIASIEEQGRSTVLLMDDARVLAIFGVADTVRPTSREAVAQLHALGVKTMMLSGDNARTVAAIAREVGIDDARGDQLPQDKLAAVEALTATGVRVGMVGDGINDAPALARADVGIAMGAAGSDTAIETADVALMDDDLRKLPALIRLSRSTARVLTQNIVLALGIKAVFLALAAMGAATMWMAVFADMGASLLVVANGLRLLRGPTAPT
jgi:Cd2+/Zn2+-exporting ATPase